MMIAKQNRKSAANYILKHLKLKAIHILSYVIKLIIVLINAS